MTGFTLRHAPPRRPASYGDASAFTITPSWPAASASSSNAPATVGIVGAHRRDHALAGDRARARRAVSASGASRRSSSSRRRTSKKNARERDAVRVDALPAEAAHRVLEALRPFVVADADRLAVEHERARRERAHGGDDLRQPVGDVVEVAGVDAHVVAVRGAPGCARRRASTRPTPAPLLRSACATSSEVAASIGSTGRSTSSRTAASASSPSVRATQRGRAQVAAEHRGASHDRERYAGGARRSRRSSRLRARLGAARRAGGAAGSRPRVRLRARRGRSRMSRRAPHGPGAGCVADARRSRRDTSSIVSVGSSRRRRRSSRGASPSRCRPDPAADRRRGSRSRRRSRRGARRRSSVASASTLASRERVDATAVRRSRRARRGASPHSDRSESGTQGVMADLRDSPDLAIFSPALVLLVELETRRRRPGRGAPAPGRPGLLGRAHGGRARRPARAVRAGRRRSRNGRQPTCSRRDQVALRSVPMKGDSGTYIHDRRDGERKVVLEAHPPALGRHVLDQLFSSHARRRARSGRVRRRRDAGAHDRAGRDLRTPRLRSRRDGRAGRRRSRGRPAAARARGFDRTC